MRKFSGIAIAIAWPEFIGKQPGSWYDTPMRWLGVNRNFHYKVGHSALILVNHTTELCYYFDCGRYHAPYLYGRIRDASTDDNLSMQTKALISGNKIINIDKILNEIQMKTSCFGIGSLYASYCQVNFELAWTTIKNLQSKGAVSFGPFTINGTNCCRFVRKVILAGDPAMKYRFTLGYFWPFKPMPISIVNLLSDKIIIPEAKDGDDHKHGSKIRGYHSTTVYTKNNVKGTLPSPATPKNLLSGGQWLSGEVAGSWFLLEQVDKDYIINRYSPEGNLECTGKFKTGNNNFNVKKSYTFTHLSHCNKVTVIQDNVLFEFHRII